MKKGTINASDSVGANGVVISGKNIVIIVDGVEQEKLDTFEITIAGKVETLSVTGNMTVKGDISGNAEAGANMTVRGNVGNNVKAGGNVNVGGNVSGNINASGKAKIGGRG